MQYAAQNIIPVDAGARRQVAEHLLRRRHGGRRRVPRQGRGRPRPLRVQQGRGLHLPVPGADPGDIYDEFMARVPGPDRGDQAGRPAGHRDHDRARRSPRSSSRRSAPTWTSAATRAPRSSPAGSAPHAGGEFADGYFFQPTVLRGHNKMRVFQEEIFGPVLAVTTFTDEAEALAIANDTLYGLGAGVWTRDGSRAFRMGSGHQGRPGLGQLLPPVPGRRRVRRVQDLRHRPRDPPDDARPLQPDQEPARQLRPEAARLLLRPGSDRNRNDPARVIATPAARQAIAACAARGGPVDVRLFRRMLRRHRPRCVRPGIHHRDGDLLLGEIDQAARSTSITRLSGMG